MSHERERTLRHGGHGEGEAQEGPAGDVDNLQKCFSKEFLNLIDSKFISIFLHSLVLQISSNFSLMAIAFFLSEHSSSVKSHYLSLLLA